MTIWRQNDKHAGRCLLARPHVRLGSTAQGGKAQPQPALPPTLVTFTGGPAQPALLGAAGGTAAHRTLIACSGGHAWRCPAGCSWRAGSSVLHPGGHPTTRQAASVHRHTHSWQDYNYAKLPIVQSLEKFSPQPWPRLACREGKEGRPPEPRCFHVREEGHNATRYPGPQASCTPHLMASPCS